MDDLVRFNQPFRLRRTRAQARQCGQRKGLHGAIAEEEQLFRQAGQTLLVFTPKQLGHLGTCAMNRGAAAHGIGIRKETQISSSSGLDVGSGRQDETAELPLLDDEEITFLFVEDQIHSRSPFLQMGLQGSGRALGPWR